MNATDVLIGYRPREVDADAEWTPGRRAAVRDRIVAASRTTPSIGSVTATHQRSRRPLRIAAAAAIAAAIPIILGLVLIPGSSTHPNPVGPAVAAADPVAVLRAAGRHEASQSATTPRGDQFLYVQDGNYQAWLSMDGEHDGLIYSDGWIPVPGCTTGCTPDPAFLPGVPTSQSGLSAWLSAQFGDDPNRLGKGVLSLLSLHYLLPEARAALFDTISTLPGLTATTNGLPAGDVGVTWNSGGGTATMVFSQAAHAYIGVVTTGVDGEKSTDLIQRTAVVDAVRQVPNGFPAVSHTGSAPGHPAPIPTTQAPQPTQTPTS